MKTSDFDFHLPDELIARYPLKNRSESRLLHVSKAQGFDHHHFSDLPDMLGKEDVLIFNNTRVIPARLFANKITGGKIEVLIERVLDTCSAYAHIKANKSLKLPCPIILNNGAKAEVIERHNDLFKVLFETEDLHALLAQIGTIPLPHYMGRAAESLDQDRYQTIYAEKDGAVAAPTAGLHFDQQLLERLTTKAIKFGFITLHVGAGTFKPVTADHVTDHRMHHEQFEISPEVCDLVNQCKATGGRIIAVGTTTVRALETVMQHQEMLTPCVNETNIFIYPGYRFRCIDALITNFHLPKSTLLMLVCALGGYTNVMRSYEMAIKEQYRFYSYGDAMFVEKNEWGQGDEV